MVRNAVVRQLGTIDFGSRFYSVKSFPYFRLAFSIRLDTTALSVFKAQKKALRNRVFERANIRNQTPHEGV